MGKFEPKMICKILEKTVNDVGLARKNDSFKTIQNRLTQAKLGGLVTMHE
jgi:hypothetical protein